MAHRSTYYLCSFPLDKILAYAFSVWNMYLRIQNENERENYNHGPGVYVLKIKVIHCERDNNQFIIFS